MAIMVGTGEGAQAGVLIKNAEALELLGARRHARRRQDRHADRRPADGDGVEPRAGIDRGRSAAPGRGRRAGQRASARRRDRRAPPKRAAFRFRRRRTSHRTPAKASAAASTAARVDLGNAEMMQSRGIDPAPLAGARRTAAPGRADGPDRRRRRPAGRSPGGRRSDSRRRRPRRSAVLKAEGLRVVMLTGDNRTTAEAIARRLGIDDVRAEVLPAGQAARSSPSCSSRDIWWRWPATASTMRRRWRRRRSASRWARAPTWRSRAPASRWCRGDLSGIVRARRLSRATLRNIRQNLFLAFVYNTLGVPIAAGVLYPFAGMLISPIWASAAMTLSSLSVIGNALRHSPSSNSDGLASRVVEGQPSREPRERESRFP